MCQYMDYENGISVVKDSTSTMSLVTRLIKDNNNQENGTILVNDHTDGSKMHDNKIILFFIETGILRCIIHHSE